MNMTLMSWPARIACIDDSTNFLQSIASRITSMGPNYTCDLFDEGRTAIEVLLETIPENNGGRTSEVFRDFDAARGNFDVKLDDLHRISQSIERFMTPAIVLVDYSMPDIDGLAVCAALREKAAQLILFTGQADESVGLAAFNDGLIDYFLPKGPDAGKMLPKVLERSMRKYFQGQCKFAADLIRMNPGSVLNDSALEVLIDRVKGEGGFTEHYYVSNPEGFLLVRADGSAGRLIIETDESMRAHEEAAVDNGAPHSLIESLRRRLCVPYFWKSGGLYTVASLDWKAYTLPATMYTGGETFYWALTDNLGNLDPTLIASYVSLPEQDRIRSYF
ncbi:MAG TPA: response regulator [Burkholderiales bacterium]|nr:response regulator [Burkholderiales bacterium]